MMSLVVTPNFVDVEDIVVMPWGKRNVCSNTVTLLIWLANEDVEELGKSESAGNQREENASIPFILLIYRTFI